MMRGLGVLLGLLSVLVPAAHAQAPADGNVYYCSQQCAPADVNDDDPDNGPANIVLYAHILDLIQRAPLTTMPPDPRHEKDLNRGMLVPTVRQSDAELNFENNWMVLYHTPRPLDYTPGANTMDGPLSYDLQLAGKEATAYWYLSPHAVPNANSTSSPLGPVGVMPRVTVEVRLETGRHPMRGTLIAEGSSTAPALVALPRQDVAFEFRVPLKIVGTTVPAAEGFVMSVHWYQYKDAATETSQNDWRVRTGLRFAPRLILPVADPMRLSAQEGLYRDGVHYISTTLAPVLGAYDVDPFHLNMTFEDGPVPVPDPRPLFYLYNPREPNSFKVVWAVPETQSRLPAGDYRFELSVLNLQQTWRLHDEVHLRIVGFSKAAPGTHATPGPELGALLFLLALGAALRRRPG